MAEPVRPPPAHLSARAARSERLLQSGEEGAAVRLLSRCTARTPTTRRATTVFTCLSHDIVAHEVTHALLDGIHPRFNEPTNPDVHAFHEAFADIVALFQHFSYPGVLRDQIARTRGDLEQREPARPARAAVRPCDRARRGAARRAGRARSNGVWERRKPDPRALEKIDRAARSRRDPGRGGVRRVPAALSRRAPPTSSASPRRAPASCRTATSIPTSPTGSPRKPRAARRPCCRCAFARSTTARRSNITFGDFLRAIVTADVDFNPDDDFGSGWCSSRASANGASIPRGIRSMSIEALTWPSGAEVFADAPIETDADAGRSIVSRREDIEGAARAIEADIVALFDEEQPDGEDVRDRSQPLRLSKWDLESDRFEVWNNMQRNRRAVWRWLVHGKGRKYARAFGLVLDDPDPASRSRPSIATTGAIRASRFTPCAPRFGAIRAARSRPTWSSRSRSGGAASSSPTSRTAPIAARPSIRSRTGTSSFAQAAPS